MIYEFMQALLNMFLSIVSVLFMHSVLSNALATAWQRHVCHPPNDFKCWVGASSCQLKKSATYSKSEWVHIPEWILAVMHPVC